MNRTNPDEPTAPAPSPTAPGVLVLFYSFSGQSGGLVQRLTAALREEGITVHSERLQPAIPLRFPVGTIPRTIRMMLTTLFRQRAPILPPQIPPLPGYQLVILAGPTWSFNPSGPVLTLLDQYPDLLHGKPVLALISCRGYWRRHWRYLQNRLRRLGAQPLGPLVFDHPQPEPWRTIGVFLKIAGTAPERSPLIGRVYRRFGHNREQFDEAGRLGHDLGRLLQQGVIPDLVRLP